MAVIPKRTKPNFMLPKYIFKKDKDQKNTCQNLWVADMKKKYSSYLVFHSFVTLKLLGVK